ncbi:PREDICTED: defensin-like protein 301 [Brassica oleracea var. oleracea]|nr:PREDICTED: defensin-like protein 301 [Brassica oleracea var. oleracea]
MKESLEMEKITIIFVVLLLISSCMIMRSEGQSRCNKVEDCDPRGCKGSRVYSGVICQNHMCTCDHGSFIGGNCKGDGDCIPDGCPPKNQVKCKIGHCTCVPKLI